MFNPSHILETALLVLAAYLLGCVLGYGIRLVLYAGRGTRQVASPLVPVTVAPPPALNRPRSPAARLAATVDEPPTSGPSPRRQPQSAAKSTSPEPEALPWPRAGRADDLKRIKGIGPKIEASLNGLGIFHFDQIAAWTKTNVDWVDGQLAFKGRIRRERWVEQASEFARARTDA